MQHIIRFFQSSLTSTGIRYEFVVTTERADGSEKENHTVHVIETSIAGAWARFGKTVKAYMDKGGRKVVAAELVDVK